MHSFSCKTEGGLFLSSHACTTFCILEASKTKARVVIRFFRLINQSVLCGQSILGILAVLKKLVSISILFGDRDRQDKWQTTNKVNLWTASSQSWALFSNIRKLGENICLKWKYELDMSESSSNSDSSSDSPVKRKKSKIRSRSKNHVVNAENGRFKCNYCDARFEKKSFVYKHIQSCTKREPDVLKCQWCNLEFVHKGNLATHAKNLHGDNR